MKSTLISLSFGLSLLVGACAPDAGTKSGPDLSLLSAGPNLPEECNPCWDDFQQCFADGQSLEECGAAIVQCVETCKAPPPPPECLHCAAGFEACAEAAEANGDSAEDCAAGFEGCLFSCEEQTICDANGSDCPEPPQPGDCDVCHIEFDACVQEGDGQPFPGDNGEDGFYECEMRWADCVQTCQGPGDPGPGPGDDLCRQVFEKCQEDPNADVDIEINGNRLSCEEAVQLCNGDPNEPFPGDGCESCWDQVGLECEDNPEACQDLAQHCEQLCN